MNWGVFFFFVTCVRGCKCGSFKSQRSNTNSKGDQNKTQTSNIMWTWVWESFHLSHFWFPFQKFICCLVFIASCAHPHYTISYQVHKISIWCSTGHVKHVWSILWCCGSCFQFSTKDVLYGVTVYSFHVPTKQSTALKSGRCGHHTVGPPVDRICWNVGADHHAQTMYFLPHHSLNIIEQHMQIIS